MTSSRICCLTVLCLFLLSCSGNVEIREKNGTDGFPIANFALTVNASGEGDFFGRILQNPGRLGEWLQDRGAVNVSVRKDGKQFGFSSFKRKEVSRAFPFVQNEYSGNPLPSAKIRTEIFCPLGINDLETSSLPVLLLETEVTGIKGKGEDFELVIIPDSLSLLSPLLSGSYSGAGDSSFQVTCDTGSEWKDGNLSVKVSVKRGETKRIRTVLSFYDREWVASRRFGSVGEITEYAHRNWADLKAGTESFSAAIPVTGNKDLDTWLRWYMVPGISLTKCTADGDVLTMGYCELNQRDSYWTTWLHLVLFKDLERKMIEESIEWMQPSGKVPTTILPLIERKDDLDINAFFILRASRFFQLYQDTEALREWWPSLKLAMDWLISRDTKGNGLPTQVSYWGDWKDVPGIEGREYSPFSCLVYLAALKRMAVLAEACSDTDAAEKYSQAYRKGFDTVNLPAGQGGLWNGSYYCQVWKDGSVNDHLLQDQTIGILFGVVPEDRAGSIIESLNGQSMTEYGIRETSPCYPEEFGYAPGTYHNGGVWPWLSFMDAWGRIVSGRSGEARNLVGKVAQADLVASGDWSPNEYINSYTGNNEGFLLQGWNAGLFGLVYFGMVNPGILP